MSAATRKEMPHLFAGIIALGLAAIIFFAAQRVLIHLEHATIVSTAPESFALKNQGLAFQRAAAHSPNVLTHLWQFGIINACGTGTGNIFFRTAPTGFQLSPVGGGGANPLIMLQKVGALGSALRGKRAGLLAFARLVLHGKARYPGVQREFFAYGGDRDGVWHCAGFWTEARHRCTHAPVSGNA